MNDLLIAHYNNFQFEELLPLMSNYNIIIYDKSSKYITSNKYNIKQLPNISREGYTYLTHIIDNYDNLSEYTIFLQDDTENHILNYTDFVNTMDEQIKNKVGFFSYGCCWHTFRHVITRDIINGIDELPTLKDGKIAKFCERLEIYLPPRYTTDTCAFFLVHRDVIRKRPVEFYKKVREWLVEDKDNEFALEHSWKIIFD